MHDLRSKEHISNAWIECICQTKDNCTPGSEVFIASRSKRPPENVNPYPELEERPRRKGRLASQVMSQSTYLGPGPELLLNAPPGPNQKRAAKVRHTTDQLDPKESEYTPCEYDEAEEKKVTPTGILEGGRQYKCTFHVPGSGDKLFMLATDCA